MDHEEDDPGTTWNERARGAKPGWMSPRMAWRAIQAALPREAIISSDIGNNCAIGNAYPTFEEGRKYLAPGLFGPCGYGLPSIVGAKIGKPDVPVVGFAGDNFVGTELNENVSYAGIATACGLEGVQVHSMDEVTEALHQALKAQKAGKTTFIEVLLNQELGEPFRRDAMKKPVAVAGINPADMRPQVGA
jgi:sulfoacetaldehyde acetyltransferase